LRRVRADLAGGAGANSGDAQSRLQDTPVEIIHFLSLALRLRERMLLGGSDASL
jgi:hypothetical protein